MVCMAAGIRIQLAIGAFLLVLVRVDVSAQATKAYSHGEPTAFEQYMLELLNSARSDPAAAVSRLGIGLNDGLSPGTIAAAPKPPLAFHRLLVDSARGHSSWMLAAQTFSHTGIDGTSPTDRASRAGYGFPAAENIGYQTASAAPDYATMTRAIHDSLVRSAGHRRNIMDSAYSLVGIGLRPGIFEGWNSLMGTQNFSAGGATDDSGPFIVGVAYADHNTNGAYDPGEGLGSLSVQTSLGGYHAVTSSSGGYCIPIVPLATNTATVPLPFAVGPDSWSAAESYDKTYRAQEIAASANTNVQVVWSGGLLPAPVTGTLTIKQPTRINFRLQGTNGQFYDRTMVTAESVKADLVVPAPAHAASVKLLPRRRTVTAGKPCKLVVVVGNNSTNAQTIPVYLGSSDPEKIPAPGYTNVIVRGKRSEKQKAATARVSFGFVVPTNALGAVQITASVGGGVAGAVTALKVVPPRTGR